MNLEDINSYWYLIVASVVIIISYFFNLVSKKWSIPSVLLLIALGVIIRYITGINSINGDSNILKILGVVGIIMIVLEASLDLKLERKKIGLISKSFFIALIALSFSAFLIALVIHTILSVDLFIALVYAIPLAIMSSAIIIPSVSHLPENKMEFLIYESTFSDILGIMFFYFLLGSVDYPSVNEMSIGILLNILITIVVSIVFSYGLIFLFQKIKGEVKLFLLISVLVLLYSVGKMMHLSSLIIILFFGLILNNRDIFIRGKMSKYLDQEELTLVFKNFKLITEETSFIVRTFFFVIFGLTISLSILFRLDVFFISILILGILYGIRWLILRIFLGKNICPELFIAPRGLITVLLFFAIPSDYLIKDFQSGILLFVIISSSIIMAWALIRYKKKLENMDDDNKGEESDKLSIDEQSVEL